MLAALAVTGSASAAAQAVTIAWDANVESDLAGYIVTVGSADTGAERHFDVGLQTAFTAPGLVAGGAYCFVVRAYNVAGLSSGPSDELCTIVGRPWTPPDDITAWMARHGLADPAADADGDGIANAEEYAAHTHPLVPNTAYLTEGATGAFDQRIALVNPDTTLAVVTLEFLGEGGRLGTARRVVAPLSRVTVEVGAEPGLEAVAASTVVHALRGGVVAERTMSWTGTAARSAAHTGKASHALARDWLLAEGDAGFFDTFLLVSNPGARPASLAVDFLLDDGAVVSRPYEVGPGTRLTVFANDVAGVEGRAFSTRVRASRPVAVERAMYFGRGAGALWRGGHLAGGIAQARRSWFVAEGRTGGFFDTWLLLGNPSTRPASVELRYLTPLGERRREARTLPRTSRTNVHVDALPGLEDTDVSVAIDSDVPIVVERSMYWPGAPASWVEGHTSSALPRLGTAWVLAEGEWGGASRADSYVLIANPGEVEALVSLTALREGGRPPMAISRTVAPRSRLTVSAGEFGLGDGERVGWIVESSVPVAVERSMYWGAGGQAWSAGTNESGTLLR